MVRDAMACRLHRRCTPIETTRGHAIRRKCQCLECAANRAGELRPQTNPRRAERAARNAWGDTASKAARKATRRPRCSALRNALTLEAPAPTASGRDYPEHNGARAGYVRFA